MIEVPLPLGRRAHEGDIPGLLALQELCFPPEVRDDEEGLRRLIRTGVVFILFERHEGAATIVGAGYAFVDAAYRDRPWHLYAIEVHPERHRKGYGRRLIRALVAEAPALCATVTAIAATDEGAALLRAEGFVLGQDLRYSRPLRRAA